MVITLKWLVVAGMVGAATAGAAEEVRQLSTVKVETWEEFDKAALSKLEEIPIPRGGWKTPKRELSKEFIAKIETPFYALAEALNTPEPGALEWHHDQGSTSVYHRWNNKKEYMGAFVDVDEEEIRSYYFKGVPALRVVEKMKTPELREKFGAELHEKCFGVKPLGRCYKGSTWSVGVDGIRLTKRAHLSAQRSSHGVWTIQLRRGATQAEVEEVRAQLKKNPSVVTPREAAATAWKHWKAVRGVELAELQFSASPILRQVTREEREPWTSRYFSGRAWKNPKAAERDPEDRIYYAVRFDGGSDTVNALVDRIDGKLVNLTYMELPW